MATYKELFQLAQDKGYNYTTSAAWRQQHEAFKYGFNNAHGTLSDHNLAAFRTYFLNEVPDLTNDIQKWLRDEHKIHISVFAMFETEDSYKTCWGWNVLELEWDEDKEHHIASSVCTREKTLTYEQALTEGIFESLKLI